MLIFIGTQVTWQGGMGTNYGITVSNEFLNGHILVACTNGSPMAAPVYYMSASDLTVV